MRNVKHSKEFLSALHCTGFDKYGYKWSVWVSIRGKVVWRVEYAHLSFGVYFFFQVLVKWVFISSFTILQVHTMRVAPARNVLFQIVRILCRGWSLHKTRGIDWIWWICTQFSFTWSLTNLFLAIDWSICSFVGFLIASYLAFSIASRLCLFVDLFAGGRSRCPEGSL